MPSAQPLLSMQSSTGKKSRCAGTMSTCVVYVCVCVCVCVCVLCGTSTCMRGMLAWRSLARAKAACLHCHALGSREQRRHAAL